MPLQATIIGKTPRIGRFSVGHNAIETKKANQGILSLSRALKKDLLSLCDINAIEPRFHNFYEKLPSDKRQNKENIDNIDPTPEIDSSDSESE